MAFVFAERTQETSTSVGLGAMTLLGAVTGYQTFANGVGQGNETYYTIYNEDDDSWEVGTGTYMSGDLNRGSVLASSNSNLFVDFAVGNKRVFGVVAAQFINNTLTQSTHQAIDHTGLPGVPAPEMFTAAAHQAVNHSAAPFNLLTPTTHQAINHKVPPLNLIDVTDHSTINHTGFIGVNAFDVLAHAAVIHSAIPGIPPAEAFTAAVHMVTDHTGIPGIGATLAPDVAVEVAYASASTDNVAATNLNLNISLAAGSTWRVFAWGAWMSANWNGSSQGNSILSIGGIVASTIIPHVGSNPDGFEYYAHFGVRSGVASGNPLVTFNMPNFPPGANHPLNARLHVFALREG